MSALNAYLTEPPRWPRRPRLPSARGRPRAVRCLLVRPCPASQLRVHRPPVPLQPILARRRRTGTEAYRRTERAEPLLSVRVPLLPPAVPLLPSSSPARRLSAPSAAGHRSSSADATAAPGCPAAKDALAEDGDGGAEEVRGDGVGPDDTRRALPSFSGFALCAGHGIMQAAAACLSGGAVDARATEGGVGAAGRLELKSRAAGRRGTPLLPVACPRRRRARQPGVLRHCLTRAPSACAPQPARREKGALETEKRRTERAEAIVTVRARASRL